jgi:hypothetical protein
MYFTFNELGTAQSEGLPVFLDSNGVFLGKTLYPTSGRTVARHLLCFGLADA